jgi:cytochrome c oxidase subunit 3
MKKAELPGNLAMTVSLVSGAMLFLTLFMGYAVYRSSATFWPPLNVEELPMTWPWVSTIIVSLSSWTCARARQATLLRQWKVAQLQAWLSLALGFLFLGSQSLLWMSLKQSGILVSSGVFASILYGFTWIHAAHMVLGVLGLAYMVWLLRQPKAEHDLKIKNVEKFWHFLGIVWALMFLALFVF